MKKAYRVMPICVDSVSSFTILEKRIMQNPIYKTELACLMVKNGVIIEARKIIKPIKPTATNMDKY